MNAIVGYTLQCGKWKMFLIVSSIRKEYTYDVNHQCGMQIQSCLNEGKGCMRSKASKFIGCNAKNGILKTLLTLHKWRVQGMMMLTLWAIKDVLGSRNVRKRYTWRYCYTFPWTLQFEQQPLLHIFCIVLSHRGTYPYCDILILKWSNLVIVFHVFLTFDFSVHSCILLYT